MKNKLLPVLALFVTMGMAANAQENWVDSNSYSQSGSIYYANGMQFLKSNEYTKAITEFKNALRENPTDKSARIQLVNAYISRAMYYNNKAEDYNKAANDLRSAIFYMKYYECAPVDSKYIKSINTMEENLNGILKAIGADTTTKGRYTMGKSLRLNSEFAAAAVEFHKAQLDSTYRYDSLVALGEIYFLLNLNDQAASYLEQAVNIKPDDSSSHLKLARVYERLGLLDKAASEYTYALEKSGENQDITDSLENIWRTKVTNNPNDAEAHSNLGAILQKKGAYDAALAEYEKAEQLNPSSITTRLNIGTMYQAKKEYDTAIEAYDTIIDFNPNYMQAYLYKAQCYRDLGNKEAAIQTYKLALNLAPNNEQIKKEMFEVVESNMSQDERLAYIKQQVEKSPSNADLLYKYAYELHKADRLSEAITYYSKVVTLNPKNEDAHINLAQAYKQQSQYDKARTVLNNAKALFPENAMIKKQLKSIDEETTSILYAKASEKFKQQQYQEAINLYKQILPATPESLVGVGASYQALGNFKEAANYYKKSLALDAKNVDTMYYIALAYSNDENYTEAKQYANKALALNPQHKDAKDLLTYVIEQENTVQMDKAIACYDQQQYAQALEILNKVLAQDAKDSNAYYYRAMVYDAQKKYALAINDYKKALQFNPQMIIANYSIAIDYDYLAQYANALTYHKRYLAETQKAGETNDCTRYSAKRIQDLKNYEPKTQAKK